MKGGARVQSGPPADPDALRRSRQSDKDTWTYLPAEGFTGEVPAWPLLEDVRLTTRRDAALGAAAALADELAKVDNARDRAALTRRLDAANERIALLDKQIDMQRELETVIWHDAWRTPQAVAWERLRWVRDVAQYVRHKALAELGSTDDAKEARQWSDRLGLNPAAMLRNRWKVVTAAADTKQRAPARRASARSRLTVVSDGDDKA